MKESVPPELSLYLDELTDRLEWILGSRLVGVYAGGSLALDAYRHGRSDVDVAAVCTTALSREEKLTIVAALRHDVFPCPARGLEFVLYRLGVARSGTPEPGFELNLNTGEQMAFRVDFEAEPRDAHWFGIDRSILADRGVAIAGPPAATVFAPLHREAVLQLLAESLEWHSRGIGRSDDAVLNAARALRFAHEGVWSSKPAASEWALTKVGEPGIVERALRAHAGGPDLTRDDALRFVNEVRRQLEAAEG